MPPLPLARSSPARRPGAPRALRRHFGIATATLAALCAIAVPRPATRASEAALVDRARTALVEMRGAIEDFRRDHGRWPGAGGVDAPLEALTADLFGGPRPYLAHVPRNPLSGRTDVRVVRRCVGRARSEHTDGSAGWVYDVARGRVWLDAPDRLPEDARDPGGDARRWMDL